MGINCINNKTTFRRHLSILAKVCNSDSEKENWRLFYTGVEHDLQPTLQNNSDRVGPIYYKHEFSPFKLDVLIHIIQSSGIFSSEEKTSLPSRLIRAFGNRYYIDRCHSMSSIAPQYCNFFETEFQTPLFAQIDSAIQNGKMIQFKMAILSETGALSVPVSSKLLTVSPYHIVCYKGIYYLIGNQRYDKYISVSDGLPHYHYAPTFQVFRSI